MIRIEDVVDVLNHLIETNTIEDHTFRLAHLMIRNMLSSERAYCGFLDKRQAHSMSLVFGSCWRIRPMADNESCCAIFCAVFA